MNQILLPQNDILIYDKDFYKDYGVFVKPIDYPLSTRKIESLLLIAEMQKYFQCNPVKMIDIMFNIELLDMQALMVQRTWICPNSLTVASRGFGKSTVIDLMIMSKGMVFNNQWTYIASGSGSQAEQTFNTLEKLANDNIDTFYGSTGVVFKNEVEIKNAAGDGFSHSSNGHNYSLYNGSMTQTLNSNIDRKRGFFSYHTHIYYSNILKGERIMITIQGYTESDLKYIKNNYQYMTVNELSCNLNKSYNSICHVIRKMGLKKQSHHRWTDDDLQFLKEHGTDMTSEEIAKHINHTISAINTKKQSLGIYRTEKWTKEEIDYLQKNYNKLTHKEIGKELNRTEEAIRAKCFNLNLFKKELPWTQNEIDFVKTNYMEMPTKDICAILNRSYNAVSIRARRMGLKKYPYMCDYHYFDIIDTEQKAYWLGFLTADGWINKNDANNAGVTGIELQYNDINHLRKFNKCIGGNYKITDRWRECALSKYNKKNHMCCIRIFSLTMYESLVKLGFSNNKSYDCSIPVLSDELIRHFMRGYFDGDGCLTFTNKTFNVKFVTASKQLNVDLCHILEKRNYHLLRRQYISQYESKIYEIELCRNNEKISFLNWIYGNSDVYLDRKYKKYLKAREKYRATQ